MSSIYEFPCHTLCNVLGVCFDKRIFWNQHTNDHPIHDRQNRIGMEIFGRLYMEMSKERSFWKLCPSTVKEWWGLWDRVVNGSNVNNSIYNQSLHLVVHCIVKDATWHWVKLRIQKNLLLFDASNFLWRLINLLMLVEKFQMVLNLKSHHTIRMIIHC